MKKLIFIFMSFLFATPIYSMNILQIFQAIDRGNAVRVRKLIAQYPSIINSTNINLYTPLHEAAQAGKSEIVQILLAAHADPNRASGLSHETPLHSAAYQDNNVDIIQALLDAGAQIDTQDSSYGGYTGGRTALHIAAISCNVNTTKKLLANGAIIDIQDNDGCTPLHYAIIGDKYDLNVYCEIVQILLNNHARTDLKAKVDGRDEQMTPLELAKFYQLNKIAQLIQDYLEARQEMRTLLQARQLRLGSDVTPAMQQLPIWIYQDIFNLLRKANR